MADPVRHLGEGMRFSDEEIITLVFVVADLCGEPAALTERQ